VLIGVIHIAFGVLLMVSEVFAGFPTPLLYDVYTFVYGVLVLVFAICFWRGKKAGWIGTAAVSAFVIAADALTVLDLPSIPGIPKGAAFAEIGYSLLVLGYLFMPYVRERFFK
jgi:hypothetical protein